MKYNVSFIRSGVYQANLIEATDERTARAYFTERNPDAEILGIDPATRDHERPGKPCIIVPADYIPTESTEAPETTEDTTTETESPTETEKTRDELEQLREAIEAKRTRSAWDRGVNAYALELLESLEEAAAGGWFDIDDLKAPKLLEKALLNGAGSWSQYSWGGSSLIYNSDIAERLCTPSELKKTRNGDRRPNAREEWLDTQARALYQASNRIKRAAATLGREDATV